MPQPADILPLQGFPRINFLLCQWDCFSQSYFFLSSPAFVSLCRWCGSMSEPLFSDLGTSFLAEPKDQVGCLLSSPSHAAPLLRSLPKLTCWWPPRRHGQTGDGMDFVPFLLKANSFWWLFHHRSSLRNLSLHTTCSFVVLHVKPSPVLQNRRGNFCSSDDYLLSFSSSHRPFLFPSLFGHLSQDRPPPQNPRDPLPSGMADTPSLY